MDQPPLTRAVVGIANTLVNGTAVAASTVVSGTAAAADASVRATTDALGYSIRVSAKAETLLYEYIGLLQDARPLVKAVAEAVDAGLIDDLRTGLRILETTVNQVALVTGTLDKAATQIGKLIPSLDKTATRALPVLESLPQTQEDIRVARETAARLEGLLNATVGQVSALPGARLVARGLRRTGPSGEATEATDPAELEG